MENKKPKLWGTRRFLQKGWKCCDEKAISVHFAISRFVSVASHSSLRSHYLPMLQVVFSKSDPNVTTCNAQKVHLCVDEKSDSSIFMQIGCLVFIQVTIWTAAVDSRPTMHCFAFLLGLVCALRGGVQCELPCLPYSWTFCLLESHFL